jgi:superoxide dismutase, Fe-Mn family
MYYTPKDFHLPIVPGLSKKTLDLHLALYKGYVKNVNLLNEQLTDLVRTDSKKFSYSIQEMRRRLGFEWNGMRLHEIYFDALTPKAEPLMGSYSLYKKINEQYGGYAEWLDLFSKISPRGPGWALLTYDKVNESLLNVWVGDHEIGNLSGLPVLLALDHWEHAYILDYSPTEKSSYIDHYLRAVNWKYVAERFEDAQGKKEK